MNDCMHAGPGKICPISEANCPGVCVYAGIMKTVNIGIVVCDSAEGTIIYANQLFSDLFGWGAGSDDYSKLSALMLTEADVLGKSHSPLNTRNHIHINGRTLGYTVYRAADKYLWIFVRDISEKLRLESVAEAVEASNNIGYIFSGVRHELGNPVNSMKVALSVLKDNYDTYSRETVMKYIDRTLHDIGRVEYLLQSLKNFNLYETQVVENFSLSIFIEKFIKLIENDIKQRGIHFTYEADAGELTAFGDQRALHQVLLNIVTNAMDALDDVDEPYIDLTICRLEGTVQISIEDNGCGISEDRKKEMFVPFYTSKPKGTGLGLVISRKMLTQMNGTIAVESFRGQGTVVCINLLERADDVEKYA